MKLALLLVAALPLLAQEPAAVAQPSGSSTFYAAGVSGLAQTSPKPTGWLVVATEVNKTADVWSLSETDYTYVSGKIQSSVRTGLATSVSIGSMKLPTGMKLYGLADAGVATTGSASSGAYAGGFVAIIPVTKFAIKFNFVPSIRVIRTAAGGTQLVWGLGLGKGGSK